MKTAAKKIQNGRYRGYIRRTVAALLAATAMAGMLVTSPAFAAPAERVYMEVGSTKYLHDNASYSLAGATIVKNNWIWESSNPYIADIISNSAPSCQIKGMKAGTAIISCTTYVTIARTDPITKKMVQSYGKMMGSVYEVTVTDASSGKDNGNDGGNSGGSGGGRSTYMKTDPESVTFDLAAYGEKRMSLEVSSSAPSNYPEFQSSDYVTVSKSQSSYSIYQYTLTVGLTSSATVGNYTAEAVLKNNLGTVRDRISIPVKVTCSHSYGGWEVTEEATCSKGGTKVRRCRYCGYSQTEKLSAGEHDVGAGWLSNESQHWKDCASCGERFDSASHEWDDGIVTRQADPDSEGVKTYTCTVCGATRSESIPRSGNGNGNSGNGNNSNGDSSNEDVGGESGKRIPEASFPSASLSGTRGETARNKLDTDSIGRVSYVSSDSLVAEVSSTGRVRFLKAGTAVITATVAETRNFQAASASYTVTVTDPGNTDPGNIDRPSGGGGTAGQKDCRGRHSYDQGAVRKEATCGEAGEKVYTCSVCGNTKTRRISPTSHHEYGQGSVRKEATCNTAGEKVFTCTVCGKTKTRRISPTYDHEYDDGVVTRQPEGRRSGRITYTCVNCGRKKTKTFFQ